MFNFVDLFAGIGGFRLAAENLGASCVFSCELDKYAVKTYQANFEVNHPHIADIRQVTEIPDADIVFAGFPCQPFSISGVSKRQSLGLKHGFSDLNQGNLFFNLSDILAASRPKYFLLENVKNLVRHDKGQTFQIILDTLTSLGYVVQWRVINASAVVPQNRERVYILGFREPTSLNLANFNLVGNHPKLASILESTVDQKYTLSNQLWQTLQNHAARHKAKGNGFTFGLVGPDDISRTLQARYYKDGSEILVKQEGKNPRRLTPTECLKLMGLPEGFKLVVSDTQAYKQLGNSVVVPVVQQLINFMLDLNQAYTC